MLLFLSFNQSAQVEVFNGSNAQPVITQLGLYVFVGTRPRCAGCACGKQSLVFVHFLFAGHTALPAHNTGQTVGAPEYVRDTGKTETKLLTQFLCVKFAIGTMRTIRQKSWRNIAKMEQGSVTGW